MQVLILYVIIVLIWGSTWAAIPYQLGVVAAEVSVAYRFALGSLALWWRLTWCAYRLRLPLAIKFFSFKIKVCGIQTPRLYAFYNFMCCQLIIFI